MSKHKTLGLLGSLIFVISQPAALLTVAAMPCYAQKLADSEVQNMNKLEKFGNKPSLLCFDYMVAAYGPPNRITVQNGIRHAIWLSPHNNQPIFEFEQQFNGLSPGMACRRFVIYGSANGLGLKDLDSKFGTPDKQHFNEVGQPTHTYQMASGTVIAASQPSCTFHVQKMSITYKGVELPLPDNDDFHEALVARRHIAFEHHDKGRHATAVPALLSYIRDYPNDAEAHIRLAESYKASACANRAITEYSTALRLSGDNPSLRQMSLDGLKSLKVYPLNTRPSPSDPSSSPSAQTSIASTPQSAGSGIATADLRPPIGIAGTPASLASANANPVRQSDWMKSKSSKTSVASTNNPLDVGF